MNNNVHLCYQLLLLVSVFITGGFAKGELATGGAFPYKVAIHNNSVFICGGALIRDDIVLTGGDCINEILKYNYRPDVIIMAGEVQLFKTNAKFRSQITKLVKPDTFLHPDVNNNIGLIKLTTPVPQEIKDYASPIELAQTETPITTPCNVTSFVNSGSSANQSMSYDVNLVDKSLCKDEIYDFDKYSNDLICSSKDTNPGPNAQILSDLGSPIVCDKKLVGISSLQYMLPLPYLSGAYLDILPHRNWIERNIFEGRLVEAGEHPYLVYLQGHDHFSSDIPTRYTYCVGVLINEDTVLTTASCTNSYREPRAVIGAIETPHITDLSGQRIAKKIKHADYNSTTNENNIALIKLTNPVLGVKFPSMTVTKNETLCTIVGWGQVPLHHDHDLTKYLLTVNVKLREHRECYKEYPGNYSDTTMLCAGDPERERNICENDLGGPIFCGGVLRGIYTFGNSCVGGPEFPSVYLDVDKYQDWIQRGDSWTNRANFIFVLTSLILSFYTIVSY